MLLTGFDLLLIGICLTVFLAGVERLRSVRRRGRPEACVRDVKGMLRAVFAQGRILERPSAGAAHLALFWGLLLAFSLGILAQFGLRLPSGVARTASLLGDVAGLALLAGLLFFGIRAFRRSAQSRPRRAWFPLALLLAMVISGFLAEGARLHILEVGWSWKAPVGGVAALLPASPVWMQVFIRLHIFALLVFIALAPFTFMRHLITAPLNAFYREMHPRGALRPVDLNGPGDEGMPPQGARQVSDLTWKQLLDIQACVSCGRCDEVCPARIAGAPLLPSAAMRALSDRMEGAFAASLEDCLPPDALWACTTCMACAARCPVAAGPLDKIAALRRGAVMGRGRTPEAARYMIRNLEIFGDGEGRGAAHREDWALHLDVPHISRVSDGAEILLWVGCSGAFHPRYRETARAMVRILQAAEVRFGILGREERCCGDPARRLGDEALFQRLAGANMAAFRKYEVRHMVCLCPHGFNTFRNEYGALDLGRDLAVSHAVPFVLELIRAGRISLRYPIQGTIAIQDPCYLSRANGIVEPLRGILNCIPDMNIRELEHTGEQALCCGGGGGRMWLHETAETPVNRVRAREVAAAGADILATACPFCHTMMSDGIGSLETDRPPRVADILELIDAALGRRY